MRTTYLRQTMNGITGGTRMVTINQFPKDDGKGSMLGDSYVGVFRINAQKQESIIKIPHKGGSWSAQVLWKDARWNDDDIFFASTAPSGGWTPANETPQEIAESDRKSMVEGTGNIQFRIGLKSTFTSTFAIPARYALVAITHTNHSRIQYLYLRQGEDPDYLMQPDDTWGGSIKRTKAKKFSPYNLTADTLNAKTNRSRTARNPSKFTKYPSQAGAYFQWSVNTTPDTSSYRRAYNPSSQPTGILRSGASPGASYTSFLESCLSRYTIPGQSNHCALD